jgi:hypothetical protein
MEITNLMEKCPTWEADSHSVTIFSTFRETSGSLMHVYRQNHILIYQNIIFPYPHLLEYYLPIYA